MWPSGNSLIVDLLGTASGEGVVLDMIVTQGCCQMYGFFLGGRFAAKDGVLDRHWQTANVLLDCTSKRSELVRNEEA